jgi:hypothetical protein
MWYVAVLGVFILLVVIAGLFVPWGPGQPLWLDIMDRLRRK